jgi:hypothetical protein
MVHSGILSGFGFPCKQRDPLEYDFRRLPLWAGEVRAFRRDLAGKLRLPLPRLPDLDGRRLQEIKPNGDFYGFGPAKALSPRSFFTKKPA